MKKELKKVNDSYDLFTDALKTALKHQRKLEEALANYQAVVERLVAKVAETEMHFDGYLVQSEEGPRLLDATKLMQETQMSFNLQYLQLQSQMQHENRSYTAISNIMKTKHDTVKNSISNIR